MQVCDYNVCTCACVNKRPKSVLIIASISNAEIDVFNYG
jgi:hypothetical protein